MAISPPTDIVMDVLNAAEPQAVASARARLERLGGPQATDAVFDVDKSAPTQPVARTSEPQAYRKFEAMVLQSFIKSMLPDGTDSVYGKGLSGDMWKGLLAQQLGNVMAERGGIGIANRLIQDRYMAGETVQPLTGVTDIEAKAPADAQDRLSVAVVQELQRRMAAAVFDDATTATGGDGGTR